MIERLRYLEFIIYRIILLEFKSAGTIIVLYISGYTFLFQNIIDGII